MNITFEEAIEYLQEGEAITLECEGYNYEVSPSDNWVGGDAHEGFISLVLGNVVYQSAEGVLEASIKFLTRDGKEVNITI